MSKKTTAYKNKRREIIKATNEPNFINTHIGINHDSHLYERHVYPTTTEHIDRVLDRTALKPTLNSTAFESAEKMQMLVRKCIQSDDNLDTMTNWLLSDSKRELQLTYRDDDVIMGTVINVNPKNHKIAEYEAKQITARFAKNPDAPNGFAVVTAFTQCTNESKPTMRDITPDMKATKAYQNASMIEKTFYDVVSNPNYDPEKMSVELEGAKNKPDTVKLSYIDEENPVYTHEFVLGAKKSLFYTRMSTDNLKKPIKTDMISKQDKNNKISGFHNPEGIADVYKKMPYFGSMMEYSFKQLNHNIRKDYKQRTKMHKKQHTHTKRILPDVSVKTIEEQEQDIQFT